MARKPTSAERMTELQRLSGEIKSNIFHMLRLAHEILGDPTYVQKLGGEAKLMERWEAEEFGHFGGKPGVPALLAAYRANPNESTWKEYRYNVHAMVMLAQPEKEHRDGERTNWKAKCQQLEEELAKERAVRERVEIELAEQKSLREKALKYIGEIEGRLVGSEAAA